MQKRQPQVHHVKSWIHLFQEFVRGNKTHDLRILDRDYQIGDTIVLHEYDKQLEKYTGRGAIADITYITSSKHVACAFSPQALIDNFCILSIQYNAGIFYNADDDGKKFLADE
jgi:hypothetical protein